jgi:1-acyl-sn-glycerol-3-phosphate acyltransferase
MNPRLLELPPSVPKLKGHRIARAIGALFARFSSWRVQGPFPDVAKCVAIAAPHSSNWDGLFGICAAYAMGLGGNWMGKDILFKGPFGPLMRHFGGIATDRKNKLGVVEQMAEKLRRSEKLWLILAPEGTRKPVQKWRTGFWHIAHAAGVPIVPAYLHWPDKVIGFGEPMMTTDDMQADLEKLYAFYAQWQGKNGKSAIPLGAQKQR